MATTCSPALDLVCRVLYKLSALRDLATRIHIYSPGTPRLHRLPLTLSRRFTRFPGEFVDVRPATGQLEMARPTQKRTYRLAEGSAIVLDPSSGSGRDLLRPTSCSRSLHPSIALSKSTRVNRLLLI